MPAAAQVSSKKKDEKVSKKVEVENTKPLEVDAAEEAAADVDNFDWDKVEDKKGIYDKMHQVALESSRATSDKRVVAPKSVGRELFITALKGIFHLVLTKGMIALPAGYGSIFLRGVKPRRQRTPQGKELDVPARWALRINAGTQVDGKIKALTPPENPEEEGDEKEEAAPSA